MPWRAFSHSRCKMVLIDWIKIPNRNNPPPNLPRFPANPTFAVRPSGVSFPNDFPENFEHLNLLYANLLKKQRAGAFSKVAVNTAIMLNDLSKSPALSLCSDDQDWDLACRVRDGRLDFLRFQCGNAEIKIDEHADIKITRLKTRMIHRIAREESVARCRSLNGFFGFDGWPGRLKLVEIARCRYTPPEPSPLARHVRSQLPPSKTSAARWWQFWRN